MLRTTLPNLTKQKNLGKLTQRIQLIYLSAKIIKQHNQMSDKSYTLKQCSKEEVDAFNLDLQALIYKHSVELRAVPIFTPDANGKYVTDAQVMLFKKIELVPKQDGQPEPSANDKSVAEQFKIPSEAPKDTQAN